MKGCLAATIASAVVGCCWTWANLGRARVHLNALEAAEAPALHERLPISTFVRWKRQLHPGESWWLDVPPGRPEALGNEGMVYRTFAIYWFLPAFPASSPADASVTFRIDHLSASS